MRRNWCNSCTCRAEFGLLTECTEMGCGHGHDHDDDHDHGHDHDEHADGTCTLADGMQVPDGWRGKDPTSPWNWCNLCTCHSEFGENGGLIECTKMGCGTRTCENTKPKSWCKKRKGRCAKSILKGTNVASKCAQTCGFCGTCKNAKPSNWCKKKKRKGKCTKRNGKATKLAKKTCAKTCGTC